MKSKRYQYRENGYQSRNMPHEDIINRLGSNRISDTADIKQHDSDWYPIQEHPDFKMYFVKKSDEHKSLKAMKRRHASSLKAVQMKKFKRITLSVVLCSVTMMGSYLAYQSAFFESKWDPFVENYLDSKPIPESLVETLPEGQPSQSRVDILNNAKRAVDSAEPARLDRSFEQVGRQLRITPHDEDAVYWYLLIQCLLWDEGIPDEEWIQWLDRTNLRVDKLARLEAWYYLRRGYPEKLKLSVEECAPEDIVCQSALWIIEGDGKKALEHATAGEAFAWRAVLDISNDDFSIANHVQIARQLKSQWPESDISYRLNCDLAIANGDWDTALDILKNIKINDTRTAKWAIKIYLIHGNFKDALGVVDRHEEDNQEILLLGASAAIQMGNAERANELLDKALSNGAGIKAKLLKVKVHIMLEEFELARALYAQSARSAYEPDERFYTVYLGVILRNFRTAGQMMVDFSTHEPEYWFLALHTAIVRQGQQQALEAIQGLVQTDVELLWAQNLSRVWMPTMDRKGISKASKSLLMGFSNASDALVLVDWGLKLPGRHNSVIQLRTASASVSTARAMAAFEKNDFKLAVSESDVAIRFDSNAQVLSALKAIALLKAGSMGRGESAMDSVVARGKYRSNARLLSIGADIRSDSKSSDAFLGLIAPEHPPRYFLEYWPQHLHRQLNEY